MDNEIINTEEYSRKRLETMTDEEKYQLYLGCMRDYRDTILKETDILMSQSDRFTPEQFDAIKEYRQALRDFINNSHELFKQGIPTQLPEKPSFLK